MPIVIKDFSWKQTDDKIFINVPLKGIDSSKVDLFISEYYIKLHYAPFIFELFLKYPIDDNEAKCCFNGKEALLELRKKDYVDWECLEANLSKCEKMNLRTNAIKEVCIKTTKRIEAKHALRNKLEKFSVGQAIEYEARQRKKIEEDRKREQDAVMKEFEEWRLDQKQQENLCNNFGNNEFRRTVAVRMDGENDFTVENIIEDENAYSNCRGFIDETLEINFDEQGMWITNLPKQHDGFRSTDQVLEQCSLHETTSVDLLLDEAGVTFENSVNNQSFLALDPYEMDSCLYETQGMARDVLTQIPNFEDVDAGDEIYVSKPEDGFFMMESEIDKDSTFDIIPQCDDDLMYEAEGAIPLNMDAYGTPTYKLRTEVRDTTDVCVDESEECQIPSTPDVPVEIDYWKNRYSSKKSVGLDIIDELDEEEEDEKKDHINVIGNRSSGSEDKTKDYLQIGYVPYDDQKRKQYSDFFRTPQPNESECSPDNVPECSPEIQPDCSRYGKGSINEGTGPSARATEGEVYFETDIKEYVIDSEGETHEQYADREIYTNITDFEKECQQIGVEITIDDKGYEATHYSQTTSCSKEEEKKFFESKGICSVVEEPLSKEIVIDNQFEKVVEKSQCEEKGSQSSSHSIESLLKEQNDLLKEHITKVDKRLDELSDKMDKNGRPQTNKQRASSGDGDSPGRTTADKAGNSKKDLKSGQNRERNSSLTTPKPAQSTRNVKTSSKDTAPRRDSNSKQAPRRSSEFHKKVMGDMEKKVVPPPRKTKKIPVNFSERIFPTPLRESCVREEERWLDNVNQCRRATGFVCEDLRPEEQDPLWCKSKGDSFYKCGNHLGAISAYSHGIKLCDQMPSLYSNRSACHLAIGNFKKCIEDCSSALTLLQPACPSNSDIRAKCIARRAVALTRVGMLSKGIDEMRAACRLQPENSQLKDDLCTMERAWEQCPDSD